MVFIKAKKEYYLVERQLLESQQQQQQQQIQHQQQQQIKLEEEHEFDQALDDLHHHKRNGEEENSEHHTPGTPGRPKKSRSNVFAVGTVFDPEEKEFSECLKLLVTQGVTSKDEVLFCKKLDTRFFIRNLGLRLIHQLPKNFPL